MKKKKEADTYSSAANILTILSRDSEQHTKKPKCRKLTFLSVTQQITGRNGIRI